MAAVEIREESVASLASYARVPIAFEVTEIFDVTAQTDRLGGFSLRRRTLEVPYVKDYDTLDGGPLRWPERFDLSAWGLFGAYAEGRRVGGAAIAFEAPELSAMEDRADSAVLWDIRVSLEHRGRGVGSALLATAETWAAARGCRRLEVETQNVNVPACGFYLRRRFTLGAIHRFAYPTLPEETQLLWHKALARERDSP